MEENIKLRWYEYATKPYEFFKELSHQGFVDFCEEAFATELNRLLPTLSYAEMKSIAFRLKIDLNDSDELFANISIYMWSHPGYGFGSKTLRRFLIEYHRFVDDLILTFPILDQVFEEEEQEEE